METYIQQAQILMEAGSYRAAIEALDVCIRKDAGIAELHANKAIAHMRLKEFDLALAALGQAISLKSEEATFFNQRASIHINTGKGEAALQDINQAIKLEPDNDFHYACRAFIKDKNGDTHGAVIDYRYAAELDPENAVTLNNLSLLEQKLGFKNAAQRSAREADRLATLQEDQLPVPEEKKETDELPKLPKQTQPESIPGVKHYFSTIRSILTDKNEFKKFTQFIRNGLKQKS